MKIHHILSEAIDFEKTLAVYRGKLETRKPKKPSKLGNVFNQKLKSFPTLIS